MAKLRIIAVGEEKTASDTRKYFPVTFREGFGLRAGTRNFWEQFRRDQKTGLPTSEKYWERGNRAEAIEAMNEGEALDGKKVSLRVEPYQIPGSSNTATRYSTIVFADENVESVFASAGHNIVDEESGEVIESMKNKKAAATSSALGTKTEEVSNPELVTK